MRGSGGEGCRERRGCVEWQVLAWGCLHLVPREDFFTRTAQAGNDTLCVCWSWWDIKKGGVCVCWGGLPVAWSHVHVTKPGPVHSHMQGKSEKEWKACLSLPTLCSWASGLCLRSPMATQAPPPVSSQLSIWKPSVSTSNLHPYSLPAGSICCVCMFLNWDYWPGAMMQGTKKAWRYYNS